MQPDSEQTFHRVTARLDERLMVENRLSRFMLGTERKHWLHNPHPQLGGSSPVDAINHGEVGKVMILIDQLELRMK